MVCLLDGWTDGWLVGWSVVLTLMTSQVVMAAPGLIRQPIRRLLISLFSPSGLRLQICSWRLRLRFHWAEEKDWDVSGRPAGGRSSNYLLIFTNISQFGHEAAAVFIQCDVQWLDNKPRRRDAPPRATQRLLQNKSCPETLGRVSSSMSSDHLFHFSIINILN